MGWLSGDWFEPAIRMSDVHMKGSEWWLKFQDEGSPPKRDLRSGIYRLIGLDGSGNVATIRRVCGDDCTGTLYIGMGGDKRGDRDGTLRDRVGNLVAHHCPEYKIRPHKDLSPLLAKAFPVDRLAMTWLFSDNPRSREKQTLQAYYDKFGELPPQNDGW
jgi:hypothetical protein